MNEQKLYPVEPGQLRALLQPVIIAQLIESLEGTELVAGDRVGLQFWGEGRVSIIRLTDGYQVFRTARQFKTVLTPHDTYGAGHQRVQLTTAQLTKPATLPVFEAHDNGDDI